MEPFDHLYLETSILEAAHWPLMTEKLSRFLQLCTLLGVDIFLPRPVEMELEEHWMRHLQKLIDKASPHVRTLREHVARAIDEDVVFKIPDEGRMLVSHRARVDQVKQAWRIQHVPSTIRPVEEFFAMATRYQLPFKLDREGAGFQDAVIYLSVVDHLGRHVPRIGALLTNDDVFEQDGVKMLATGAGVTLKVYRTIDAAYNALVDRVKQAIRQAWEARRTAATQALNGYLPMIKGYLIRNLDVSGIRVGLFEEPLRVELQEIAPVEEQHVFPPLPEVPEPPGPHRIEFMVRVTFAAVVERAAEIPGGPPLRIGEERPTGLGRFLPYFMAGPPQMATIPVTRNVDAEATADFVSGAYRNLQMANATLQPLGPVLPPPTAS